MIEHNYFPLLSGHIALDLINTVVMRREKKHELLNSNEHIYMWLEAVSPSLPFLKIMESEIKQQLLHIRDELIPLRTILREHFEAIAKEGTINNVLINLLESLIKRAPHTYKLIDGQLITFPIGKIEHMITSMIALNVLELIRDNLLTKIKRCNNEDCVLLFIDTSGRRKWCSMKICGNRNKVANFQYRQTE